MNTVTIPKEIASQGDLVVLPRAEYEALLSRAEGAKDWIYDSKVVSVIKKRSLSARKEHLVGKTTTWSIKK